MRMTARSMRNPCAIEIFVKLFMSLSALDFFVNCRLLLATTL